MSSTDLERFVANWRKFSDRVKGKMMTEAKKGRLSCPVLKLMLADCIEYWDSRQEAGGRWLEGY